MNCTPCNGLGLINPHKVCEDCKGYGFVGQRTEEPVVVEETQEAPKVVRKRVSKKL